MHEEKKIKLLLVSSVFGDRGAEALILYLYNFLPKDRYKINILCLRDLAPYAEYLNENAIIKIHVAGMKNNLDIFAVFRFYRHIKEFKPDIINFHHFRAALWGRPLAKLAGTPVVLYSVHNKWGGAIHHFLDRLMSPLTDAIVPFSHAVRNYLLDVEGIQKRYLEIPIYAGIDTDKFSGQKDSDIQSLKYEIGLREGQNIIGFVGNVNVEKGLIYLIESIRTISSRFPDICCLIIGEGSDEEFLKSKVREYGLESNIKFLGQRQDIHNILKLLTLFVLPSLREGLPIVIVEAMAASCPVIATNVDGIPEIITHNENGLLVPPKNSVELSNAIDKLLSSEKLRGDFAAKGYQTAANKFSIKKMVDSYDKLYQSYLKRNQ